MTSCVNGVPRGGGGNHFLHSESNGKNKNKSLIMSIPILYNAGLETNARPRRVKFCPGEWFVRPDQPGGRVEILRGFIDHVL